MAQSFNFRGVGFSLQGDKNRFVLPPAFRKQAKDASGGSRIVYISKHDRWPCLTGFGTSRIEAFEAEVARAEAAALGRAEPFDVEERWAQLNTLEELPFDESGRFVLPGYLVTQGNLAGEAYFNGNGPFFTIWNPALLETMGSTWEPMKAACRALGEEARASKAKRA